MASIPPNGLHTCDDNHARCWWCGDDPEYIAYHDTEWGVPVDDDVRLFEKICLEGFQSGLSWLTILRKRENFRDAFDGFDFTRIARYTPKRVEKLLTNAGIVRHRGKIESVINNAKRMPALCDEFGSLAAFAWSFEPAPDDRPASITVDRLPELTRTPASTALSKALRKRGWSFVGPTTAYAFMQSVGIVNDHLEGCHRRPDVDNLRMQFRLPRLPSRSDPN
ncbi:MAG: DNA-3-methyladenine glycosylase I [Planctomycetota bacterium]